MKRSFLLIYFILFFTSQGVVDASSEKEDVSAYLNMKAQELGFTYITRAPSMQITPPPELTDQVIDEVQSSFNRMAGREVRGLAYVTIGGQMYYGPWSMCNGVIQGPYFESQVNETVSFRLGKWKFCDESKKISVKAGQKLSLNLKNQTTGYTVNCYLKRDGQGVDEHINVWRLSKGQNISKEIINITEDGKYYVEVSAIICLDGSPKSFVCDAQGTLQVSS